MNLNDIDIKKLEYMKKEIDFNKLSSDKLETMFIIQDKLREKFGVPIKSLDTREGQSIARDMAHNIIEEICESVNLFKNHSWSKDEKLLDRQHFKEETGDVILFLIEYLILCGYTANDIYELYLKIAEKNFFRLASRY